MRLPAAAPSGSVPSEAMHHAPGSGAAEGPGARPSPVLGPGPTPLVAIPHPELPHGVVLHAKLESVHPGGSVKDRSVARILAAGVRSGALDGRSVLDSSSGNAAIAYAQFGALYGIPVTLVVPANASRERLDRIRSHGAELVLTDPMDGYDAAISTARELAARHPGRYWYADQYANPENWRAHYHGTGSEIVRQFLDAVGVPPDGFVSGIGTGGSITGVGRRLREADAATKIVAVIPERFPGIEGLKPLGAPGDHVPEILDERLIDERHTVTSELAAARCVELARLGHFVGPSSGANLHVALALAATRGARRVVTLFPDTGERYLSTGLWQHEDSEP